MWLVATICGTDMEHVIRESATGRCWFGGWTKEMDRVERVTSVTTEDQKVGTVTLLSLSKDFFYSMKKFK